MSKLLPLLRQPHRYRASKPPTWPFAVNRDSWQSVGLTLFLPMLGPGFREYGPHSLPVTLNANETIEPGPDGQAMRLTSSNFDRVDIAASPAHDTLGDASHPVTVHARVYVKNKDNSSNNTVTSKGYGGGSTKWFGMIVAGTNLGNGFDCYWDNGSSNGRISSVMDSELLTPYSVTGVYDNAQDFRRLYVDGALEASDVGNGDLSNSENFSVGQLQGATGSTDFNGLIWDVRYYDVPWTGDQVAEADDPAHRWDLFYEVGRTFYSFPAGGAETHEVAALLAASGNATAANILTTEQTASLGAAVNVTAAASLIAEAAATLASSGNLTATQTTAGELEGAALLGASVNLAAAGALLAESGAALGASTDLAALAERVFEVSASLASSLEVSATGAITTTVEVSAALGATFDQAAALDYIAEGFAALGLSANLSSSVIANMLVDAGIGFSGELTPIGPVTSDQGAALAYSVNLTATGLAIVTGLPTPDGRKIVILSDSRTVRVLSDSRIVKILD